MGRLIKCQAKNCNKKIDKDKAFTYYHYTKSGKLQKKYYCNRDEFHKEHMDIVYYHYTKKGNLQKKKYCNRNEFHEEHLENMWYNRSRRRVDRILGVNKEVIE